MSWCARSLYFGSGLMLVAAIGNVAAFCQTQQPVTRPKIEVHGGRMNKSKGRRLTKQRDRSFWKSGS